MSLKIEVRQTPSAGTEHVGSRRGQGRPRRTRSRSRGMSRTSGRIGPATRMARESTSLRIHGARGWSAPRVENAARYVEDRLGPGVGSFLSATARMIEPTRPDHRSRNTGLIMLGIMGLFGVLGALATRRSTMFSRAGSEEMMEEPTTEPTPMGSRPTSGGRLHTT